jgi:ABC-type Fe3+-hydroxamate transport system substrate-binding protein
MRKLMITAALATVALAGAAGCADNSVKPSSSASASTAAPTTSAADQTKAVCEEAGTVSTTAGEAIAAKAKEVAAASGDQTKQLKIGGELITLANDWSAKLTELSAKPIKPEVKQALTDGATTIKGLTNPVAIQTANAAEIESKLKLLVGKISAACG